MTAFIFYHKWEDGLGYIQQTFEVSIDHDVPIIKISFTKYSLPNARPALLMRTSIFCHSSGIVSMALKTFSCNCTSNGKSRTAVLNLFSRSCFTCSSLSSLLPLRIRSYPCAANFSAHAFPKPDVAPVINTIFGIVRTVDKFKSL